MRRSSLKDGLLLALVIILVGNLVARALDADDYRRRVEEAVHQAAPPAQAEGRQGAMDATVDAAGSEGSVETTIRPPDQSEPNSEHASSFDAPDDPTGQTTAIDTISATNKSRLDHSPAANDAFENFDGRGPVAIDDASTTEVAAELPKPDESPKLQADEGLTPIQERAWEILENSHGLVFVDGLEFKRQSTYVVTDVDHESGEFSGMGTVRRRMPFQEVDFSGKVLPDGVVTVRFSHTNRTYNFDRIDDASLRSPKGNGGLRALTPTDADRIAAYDAEIAAITAGRPPRFKSTVVPPGERARRLQRKDYFHAPADGYKTLGTRDDARMLTDGAHNSYWYGARDGWVGLRYPEPVRAAGLLIATSTGGTDAVPVVTLTVNGVASEPLPHAGNGLIEVRFGRTMQVVDVELELFGSRVYIQEVYLLKPR